MEGKRPFNFNEKSNVSKLGKSLESSLIPLALAPLNLVKNPQSPMYNAKFIGAQSYQPHTGEPPGGGADTLLASKMFKHGRWQYTKLPSNKNHVGHVTFV